MGCQWPGQGILHAELVEALDPKDGRIFEAMTSPPRSVVNKRLSSALGGADGIKRDKLTLRIEIRSFLEAEGFNPQR